MIINEKTTFETLKKYFSQYREVFHKRGYNNFLLLVISIIASQRIQSIKFLHENFISKHWNKSINSLYYFLKFKDNFVEDMIKITVKIVKFIIGRENSKEVTIYLSVDDTIIPKWGSTFEKVSKLFDHAKHNGTSYVNGHCFVCLVMTIPISNGSKNLTVPLGYKVFDKSTTKLELAKQLVECAMTELSEFQVILMCDSWYTNATFLNLLKNYNNLELMGAVRKNIVLRDTKVPERTGKRGRPRKHGEKLDYTNFEYEKEGKFYVATVECMTNLYHKPVKVTVTTTNIQTFSSVRCFISTINISDIKTTYCDEEVNTTKNPKNVYDVYKIRWQIETLFYQHKKFWSLELYMVRNKIGIEKYANLIGVCYSAMILIPFISEAHKQYKCKSPQEIKYAFSELINRELIFCDLLKFQQNEENIYNLPNLYLFNDIDDLAS